MKDERRISTDGRRVTNYAFGLFLEGLGRGLDERFFEQCRGKL